MFLTEILCFPSNEVELETCLLTMNLLSVGIFALFEDLRKG